MCYNGFNLVHAVKGFKMAYIIFDYEEQLGFCKHAMNNWRKPCNVRANPGIISMHFAR